MQLDVLDVCRCTTFVLMHKKTDMDDQGDPWCIWISWMSIDIQGVSRCTKGFIWMLKMTLDEAGCLQCLEIHKLWLDAPRDLFGCSRWPSMQLDVYWRTSCALMQQHIFMDDQDDPWWSWMSIDTQVVPWCSNTFLWMLKIIGIAEAFSREGLLFLVPDRD